MNNSIFVATTIALAPINIAAVSSDDNSTPKMAVIQHIESVTKMPDRSAPIEKYTRYYAGITIGGRPFVFGRFKEGGDGGIHLVSNIEDLPNTPDGGCSFLRLRFDVEADRFTELECNAEA